ncbi:MAG: RsmB/NOP family class I SAM-dependent RNA methyltransferase, partial [Pseudomonadota bacterium]
NIPLDITVKNNPEKLAKELGGEIIATGQVRIFDAGKIEKLSGYTEGEWWVQDAASALPVLLLGNIKDKIIFDLCAAPGGKTAQLISAGARVIAVDKSKKRIDKLKSNMNRLGFQPEIHESDILNWQPTIKPDVILLDAPCSATGTFRRHPEVIWHHDQKDVMQLAEIQRKLLAHIIKWIGSGGQIVYCVCSLQPEEGEEQIDNFLSKHKDFFIKKPSHLPNELFNKQGAIRTLPNSFSAKGGIDGFYAVLLEKR